MNGINEIMEMINPLLEENSISPVLYIMKENNRKKVVKIYVVDIYYLIFFNNEIISNLSKDGATTFLNPQQLNLGTKNASNFGLKIIITI